MKKLLSALAATVFAVAALAQAALPVVEGEVRKVDLEAGKITIRHGDIGNLDMPAMTMVFRARDPVMLDTLRPGDKVKFTAGRIDGALTVLSIEPARGD